jgi:hypothetical protein
MQPGVLKTNGAGEKNVLFSALPKKHPIKHHTGHLLLFICEKHKYGNLYTYFDITDPISND